MLAAHIENSCARFGKFLAVLGFAVVAPAFAESPPWKTPTYGTSHQQDFLVNTVIKAPQAAIRFRAEHTGHVAETIFYLVWDSGTPDDPATGYSGGSGGSALRVEIRPDDPNNPGFPSTTVLGQKDLNSPKSGLTRPVVSFGSAIVNPSDLSSLPYLQDRETLPFSLYQLGCAAEHELHLPR